MTPGHAPANDGAGELAPLNLPDTVLVEADIRRALWGYSHEGGVRPGSFFEHIVRAFLSADDVNTMHLSKAYPVLAFWMDALGNRHDGMTVATKALLTIAGRAQSPDGKPWNMHLEPCPLRHPAYWTRASRDVPWFAPADLPCLCEQVGL